jgi:uncharacterized protein YndB with AHSA1/START domain
MSYLRKTVSIEASPETVWTVLGDLAATSDWLPGTVAARMEGPIRICDTADGNEIREEITDYSPARRTFRYRHLQVPLPVKSSAGKFAVEAGSSSGAVVVIETEFDALDPALESEIERMFGGALEQALESLRRRVEQGISWQAA